MFKPPEVHHFKYGHYGHIWISPSKMEYNFDTAFSKSQMAQNGLGENPILFHQSTEGKSVYIHVVVLRYGPNEYIVRR